MKKSILAKLLGLGYSLQIPAMIKTYPSSPKEAERKMKAAIAKRERKNEKRAMIAARESKS